MFIMSRLSHALMHVAGDSCLEIYKKKIEKISKKEKFEPKWI
jgi:hypothetical protein